MAKKEKQLFVRCPSIAVVSLYRCSNFQRAHLLCSKGIRNHVHIAREQLSQMSIFGKSSPKSTPIDVNFKSLRIL